MMNKNCSLVESNGLISFNKTKNGSKAAAFSLDYAFDPSLHKQVSWLYLDAKPDANDGFSSIYSLEEIVSKIDSHAWFWEDKEGNDARPAHCLAGNDFREWRGTVNKWNRLLRDGTFSISKLDASNAGDVLEMIEKWRYLDNGGMKYGWQERAGCDKALVNRYVSNFESMQDYVIGSVFKVDGNVIGYSCIEKGPYTQVDGIPEVKYITRKVLCTKGARNITEYVDYKTIELVHKNNMGLGSFLVNWGASSGGVHWYKTHKFPLYSIETKWFASRKS